MMNGIKQERRTELSARLDKTLKDRSQTFTRRYESVRSYLDAIAKPVGSLGSIEDFGARIAALQRSTQPSIDNAVCLIFAADHGVAKDINEWGMVDCLRAVSGRKILESLDHGIAGASVLAKTNDVSLRAVDVGLADGAAQHKQWSNKVVHSSHCKVKGGTKNFCTGNALHDDDVEHCFQAGREETAKFIDELESKSSLISPPFGNMVIFGDVGAGSDISALALIAALTGESVESIVSMGNSTMLDKNGDEFIAKRSSIIKEAMEFHGETSMIGRPLEALKAVGGADITAIVGGMLEASDRDVPILVDGFVVTTAAMIACQMDPAVARVLLFATKSTEKGQNIALGVIDTIAKSHGIPAPVAPALDMNITMGEANGALMAVPLARSACAMISNLIL